MSKLATRLPDFADVFDGTKMRALVQHLEQVLARVTLDTTSGAYTRTADFTVDHEDGVVLVDTTAGSVTVTLPIISDWMIRSKYEVTLVKSVAANNMVVAASGTDTIIGYANITSAVVWTVVRVRATTGLWVRL